MISRTFALLLAALFFVVTVIPDPASAQRRGLPLVRDAEIEHLIRDYSTPLFRAAGFPKNSVDVFLLNRPDFNAFVTGTRMFLNTGAIMQADTPNEIIGVLAHETGHIVGGHLVLLRKRIEQAQILTALGAIAGAGAVAAGSSGAGAALITGAAGVARRGVLAYQREEEMAADRTGITLLNKTGQSGLGMLNTFKRLGQNPLFSSGKLDPYALSHPLPRERIGLLKTIAEESPYFGKRDSATLQLRHDLARAKIAAYTGGAGLVRNVFKKQLNGPAGTYGIAISHFLYGSPRKGVAMMDRLIKNAPNNPYFHEMRGEMLLKSGKARQAADSFAAAVKLDGGKTGLLRIQLGHALIESGDRKSLDRAIKELQAGTARDEYSSRGYVHLARAYAATGQQEKALVATAEARFLQGNLKEAKQFAARVQPRLKRGSPGWLRMQDILQYEK